MRNTMENINTPNNGKTMAGVILLIIGGILLINQFNFFFIPNWLFSWPMWLIVWGLYMGGKHNFRKPIWAVMVILGIGFLLTENIYGVGRLIWPLVIIGSGAWLITRNKLHPGAGCN